MQVLRGSHSSHQPSKLANSSGWRARESRPAFCWNLHETFKSTTPSHIIAGTSSLTCSGQWNSFSCHLITHKSCIEAVNADSMHPPPSLDTLSLVEGIGAQTPRLQPPGSHRGDTEDMSSVMGPCGCVSWCFCNVSIARLGYQPSSNSREETVGYKTPQSCMVSRDSGARQQSFPSGYTHLRFVFWSSGWHWGRPQPPPAGFGSRKDVLISEFMSYRGAV